MQPLRAEDPRLPAVLARFRSLGRPRAAVADLRRALSSALLRFGGRLLALALRESFVVPLPLAARSSAVSCRHRQTMSLNSEATVLRQLRGEKERLAELEATAVNLYWREIGWLRASATAWRWTRWRVRRSLLWP